MAKASVEKGLNYDINKALAAFIVDELLLHIPDVIDAIMNGYDGLSSRVNNPKSESDPAAYRDIFEERLVAFEFIEVMSKETIRFITPDIENFDLKGLPLISQIFSGTSGVYVEVKEEYMEKVTGKSVITKDPIDSSVPKQKRIYLVKYTSKVKQEEKNLEKDLVRFPFSNSPPLDHLVFGEGEELVADNLDKWIERAVNKSRKAVINKYKGMR